MELLHNGLTALNDDLAGIKVIARGKEYCFSDFELDTQRIPPVASGYVLHLRLLVSVWRWEEKDCGDGKRWIRARYSFPPQEVTFVADKQPPVIPGALEGQASCKALSSEGV